MILSINKLFNAAAITLIVSSIFTSCQDDVYDPNYRTPSPMPELQTTANFDWSTTNEISLTVNANDEYEGKFYYEISVYDENPFSNKNAQLLTKGLAKKGKDFSTVLTIPKDSKELYVCQTMIMKNGKKRNALKIITVDNKEIICDFTNTISGNSQSNASKSIMKSPTEEREINVPADAIKIEGNGTFTIEQGKNYVVEANTTFNGILNWYSCQNAQIYIMGTLAPQNRQEINNRCDVYVGKSGVYHSEYLLINSNCDFINNGIVNIDEIRIDNSGSTFSNYGQFTATKMTTTSDSHFHNYCYTSIDDLDIQGNRNFTIGQEAMLLCKSLKMNNSTISLNYNAILKVTESAFFDYNNDIKASDDGAPLTALAIFNDIKVKWGGLYLKDKLQVLFKNGHDYDSNYIKVNDQVTSVFSEEETIGIPASGCNGEGNNVPTDEPEGSGFPIIVSPDNSYTFLMEDNWPVYGDYDMNDLVMDIKLSYKLEDNDHVSELGIIATLRAVGATKSIGAAIQLDKVKRTDIQQVEDDNSYQRELDGSIFVCSNGTENDQEYAVIPFFDNAHKALGITTERKPVNTRSEKDYEADEKTFKVLIKFNKNIQKEDINVNNLNFFIVTDGKKQARKEVHLKGFEPTQRASRKLLGSNCDDYSIAPYLSKDNLIWGLMVPSGKDMQFQYPAEYQNIKKAYPMFEAWVTSQGNENKDWYKIENGRKEYIYTK